MASKPTRNNQSLQVNQKREQAIQAVEALEVDVPEKLRLVFDVSQLKFKDMVLLDNMAKGEISFSALDEVLERCVTEGDYSEYPLDRLPDLLRQLVKAVASGLNPKN